ncbi:MAG: exo-alpha-sialidase [Verrucomicrobiae bacterium]|nr:exo-alpha-sialidase [Verrucomicrobiae bacterium]
MSPAGKSLSAFRISAGRPVLLALVFGLTLPSLQSAPEVSVERVPWEGIQSQAAVDHEGNLHLLYFRGDPRAGNLFHTVRLRGERAFRPPVQVNETPGAAIAMGTIRGGQLAIGRQGIVHVSWMGSGETLASGAKPAEAPMLYSRSTDGGKTFEPERNLITSAQGLDGGGSVAADAEGNVHVFWHAPERPGAVGEDQRGVWVASSTDDGAVFSPERIAWDGKVGACGCCGLKSFSLPTGTSFVLFRSAESPSQRDIYLLSRQSGIDGTFSGHKIDAWNINRCPMSSAAFAASDDRLAIAWESRDRVYFQGIDSRTGAPIDTAISPEGHPHKGQKHPSLAIDEAGNLLLVWMVPGGWGAPGRVEWRVFLPDGTPTDTTGLQEGVPPWSMATATFQPGSGFSVFY